MQPTPPYPAPTPWWWIRTSVSPLFPLVVVVRHIFCVCFFFFSQLCCHLKFQNSPQTHLWEGFLLCENISCFTTRSPGWVSIPKYFIFFFFFSSFIFCPASFWRDWVAFLGARCSPPVFRSCFVEVARLQMIFLWICEGESGLPVLFLHHLVTASSTSGLSFFFFFFFFFYISWRLITSQHFSGFCHTLTWIRHGVTCIPHPDPPSHLPLHPIPLGLPSAPGPSTCLMHPTWAGDLFHYR